jgi:hypothetical protein
MPSISEPVVIPNHDADPEFICMRPFVDINGFGQLVGCNKGVKQQCFATGKYREAGMSVVSKFHNLGFLIF